MNGDVAGGVDLVDGNFVAQSRKYAPLVKSRGFTLELPPFRPTANHVAEYRLDGLPLMNEEMTIALVTFVPPTGIPPDELQKHDFTLPPSPTVSCELVDERTGRTIGRGSSTVNELPMTSVMALRHAPFVKEVLLVRTDTVPPEANLTLRIDYRVGEMPLDQKMLVLIVNEPPRFE